MPFCFGCSQLTTKVFGGLVCLLLGLFPALALAQTPSDNWTMFGGTPQRNMVNPKAKNAPTDWNVEGGEIKNIKWVADLGTTSYGGVVVADGRVFVGTNNKKPRDPNDKGPKAILMCFQEKDGKYLWQAVHDMPPPDVAREALHDGMCGTPTVVGNRLYYVTPAAVLVCAETETGNSVWKLDMMEKLKVFPCFVSNCAPLVVDDTVYVITGNGTNEEGELPSPEAPSFLAVNTKTKEILWQSNLPGKNVIEGQWSNPTYAEVNGKGQILFAGGDCWLYGLEPKTGEVLWKFHCNSKKDEREDTERGLPNYIVSTPVVHKNKAYVGIGLYPGHFAGNKVGHFWCIDLEKATKFGATNPDHNVSPVNDNFDPKAPVNQKSALAWHFGGELNPRPMIGRSVYFGKTVSTAAVQDGLVYITEEMGYLHCLDAETGKKYWEHDFLTGIWGSPFWVDGKVYVGTEEGDIVIFAHGKKKKVINTIYMEDAIYGAPVLVNGTLLVSTKTKLYAIGGK